MLPSAPLPNSLVGRERTQMEQQTRARRVLRGPNAPRQSLPSQSRVHLGRTPTPVMEGRALSVPRGRLIMCVRPLFVFAATCSDAAVGIDQRRNRLLLLLLGILLG